MTSILDIAVESVEKSILESLDEYSRSVFIVGSKSAGKSTIIHSFLEKHDAVKETLVLEYSFGRKSSPKQGMEKTICHVWEYGGRLEMLKTVLKSIPTNENFTYFIIIDLSKIKTIWNVLETCLKAFTEHFGTKLPDLVILGGKYDLFRNYDSELKKFICLSLRSVALIYNADLLFYSSKEPQLIKKTKELLHSVGFGVGVHLKEKNTNYNKPLMIPKGTDSWEHIGSPSTFEEVRVRYISRITSDSEIMPEIKSLQRTHPEPILDSLAALKYEELKSLDTFDMDIDEYLDYMHK